MTVILLAGLALAQPPKLKVAASIVPLGDFCRQLGGDRVEVQVLIPPGASPHTFEPSPKTLTALAQAKVLVFIGSGLEPWMDRFLRTLRDPKPVLVEATHGIDLIQDVPGHVKHQEAHEHKHPPAKSAVKAPKGSSHGHSHDHGAGNPHIWLDPILAQDICRRLAQALMEADPANRSVYEQNLERYVGELSSLHNQIASETAGFRVREFVSFHPSFTYFARRYALKEVGVIEVAPGREPTPRSLQNIKKALASYGIKVIFAEPQFSSRIAEVLARDAGASVLFLDPVGGHPPYGDDYLKMMQYNLETMAKAMK